MPTPRRLRLVSVEFIDPERSIYTVVECTAEQEAAIDHALDVAVDTEGNEIDDAAIVTIEDAAVSFDELIVTLTDEGIWPAPTIPDPDA